MSARSMFERLKSKVDPLTPDHFIQLGEPYLRSLGITRQKAHYVLQLARAFSNGHLDGISRMKDEDAHAALLQIKGIGPWTANIYLLMALRRPDIWPTGDIALATVVRKLRKMNRRPSFAELSEIAEAWRPFRSVAARMLWQSYLAERNRL